MAIEKQVLQGFTEAKKTEKWVRRLVIAVEGRERTGKTTFGLSAPGPLAFFPLDPGREGVLEKSVKSKKILLPTTEKGEVETFDYRDATSPKDYERLWDKFKSLYYKALESKEVKSIVVDTATEAWELLRITRFGKLTQVQPYHYGPVNAEFRDMIKQIYKTDKNLILIHKVKNEYVNDKRTGEMERAGFGDTGYLVQINLTLGWDFEEGFSMFIKDCRQNMVIAGTKVNEPMNTFPFLATQVYPESELENWE
jgi:hypothetical protein